MNITSTAEELRSRAAAWLSQERYAHVERVAHLAEELARRFDASHGRVRIAAWGHDLYREHSPPMLLALAHDWQVDVSSRERRHPVLLHGAVAARVLQHHYRIEDPPVLLAVRHHTLGSVELVDDNDPVGLILYIADFCEPGRTWPEEEVRRAVLALPDPGSMVCRIVELSKQRYGTVEEPTVHLYARLQRDNPWRKN